MTQFVKQPANKYLSNQRAVIEARIEWVAVNSFSFCWISHPLFRVMIQRTNSDAFVPVYHILSSHIKCLADIYPQLPEHEEKSYCCLMVDEAKKFDRRLLVVIMFMERCI
jgi:hypothetical protein